MKNIIAYSLWGDKPMYWIGALKNIELAKIYFPDFICRFYVDSECPDFLVNTLINYDNSEVIRVGIEEKHEGMYWRFKASQDEDVNIFLSRDCDSRLSLRESKAIEEWLNSDKDFHIMRDHPYHTTPILGGMWGSRNGIMKKIGLLELMKQWRKRGGQISNHLGHRNHAINAFGDDQEFLKTMVYPLVINNSIEHSEFNISFGGEIKPFPTQRNNYEFVGDVFDENDIRHPDYWKLIKNITG